MAQPARVKALPPCTDPTQHLSSWINKAKVTLGAMGYSRFITSTDADLPELNVADNQRDSSSLATHLLLAFPDNSDLTLKINKAINAIPVDVTHLGPGTVAWRVMNRHC